MTQDDKWILNYEAVIAFIKANHRNPSKYAPEERGLLNWCKQQRKLINAGKFKQERIEQFNKLTELWEENKRVNQWV